MTIMERLDALSRYLLGHKADAGMTQGDVTLRHGRDMTQRHPLGDDQGRV